MLRNCELSRLKGVSTLVHTFFNLVDLPSRKLPTSYQSSRSKLSKLFAEFVMRQKCARAPRDIKIRRRRGYWVPCTLTSSGWKVVSTNRHRRPYALPRWEKKRERKCHEWGCHRQERTREKGKRDREQFNEKGLSADPILVLIIANQLLLLA